MPDLRAPFPWFGGKSRAASLIWARFGDVPNYVEPFAGSLAVLLGRPHAAKTETVNDLDAYVVNFWRAVQADPDAVWAFADQPVFEADLHARHVWLIAQSDFRERMLTDPAYFDVQIAGWWVWGISSWIGSGWCETDRPTDRPTCKETATSLGRARRPTRQLPELASGRGIQADRYRSFGRGDELARTNERTNADTTTAIALQRRHGHQRPCEGVSLTPWLIGCETFGSHAATGLACSGRPLPRGTA